MYRVALVLCAMLAVQGCFTQGSNSSSQIPDYNSDKADPSKAQESYLELAMAYLRAGNRRQARFSLNRALEIDRRSAAVHNAFGLLYHSESEYELAEKSFRQAIAIDRRFSQAYNNYAHFLALRNRYKDALRNYRKAAEDVNYPMRSSAYTSMGHIYLRLGQRREAKRAFTDAIRRDPSLQPALRALVVISHEDGNYADVLRYSRAIQPQGHSRESLSAASDAARRLGDRGAEQTYRMLLEHLGGNDGDGR